MAKIIINDILFEQLSNKTFYEAEYEKIIERCANILFPDFFFLPFKTIVQSEDGSARPDYALIDKEYRDWWVVEIEMSYHSLETHVIPQVRTLSNATYSKEEATILARNSFLNYNKLLDMLKGKQPNVLVMVNAALPDWIVKLKPYNCLVTFFEIFITETNQFAYRINGQLPNRPRDFLSKCIFEKLIPNFLRIEAPAGLGISQGKEIKIYYKNEHTFWKRVDIVDNVWLIPVGKNPLETNKEYILFVQQDGNYIFEENS